MDIVRRDRGSLWDPVGQLDRIRREIDDMFGEGANRVFSVDRPGFGLFDRELSPTLDLVERADDYLVRVDLPGVDQSDIEVTVADGVLTIKGEKKVAEEHREGKVYRKETWEGSFHRTLSLPSGTDATGIDASINDGVLEVRLPKREEARPRQIAVAVK